jgi:hypothetical protein
VVGSSSEASESKLGRGRFMVHQKETKGERMKILKLFDPRKKKWWRKSEWVRVTRAQNIYEVVEEHSCPSWDLEFHFAEEYKHKETCEVRWRLRKRVPSMNKTIFNEPQEYVNNCGKTESHYKLMRNIDVYNGPDYEE